MSESNAIDARIVVDGVGAVTLFVGAGADPVVEAATNTAVIRTLMAEVRDRDEPMTVVTLYPAGHRTLHRFAPDGTVTALHREPAWERRTVPVGVVTGKVRTSLVGRRPARLVGLAAMLAIPFVVTSSTGLLPPGVGGGWAGVGAPEAYSLPSGAETTSAESASAMAAPAQEDVTSKDARAGSPAQVDDGSAATPGTSETRPPGGESEDDGRDRPPSQDPTEPPDDPDPTEPPDDPDPTEPPDDPDPTEPPDDPDPTEQPDDSGLLDLELDLLDLLDVDLQLL